MSMTAVLTIGHTTRQRQGVVTKQRVDTTCRAQLPKTPSPREGLWRRARAKIDPSTKICTPQTYAIAGDEIFFAEKCIYPLDVLAFTT